MTSRPRTEWFLRRQPRDGAACLGTATVQSIWSIQRTVLYSGMQLQFWVVCEYPPVEVAFPLHLDLVPCLRYVL